MNERLNRPQEEPIRSIDLSRAPEDLGPRIALIIGVVLLALVIGWLVQSLPFVAVVALFVGTTFIVISLANPYWGLLGYLVWEYVRPAEMYPMLAPLHLQRVIAVVVMAAWFLSRLRENSPKLVSSPQNKAIIALGIVAFLAVPMAVLRSQALDSAIDFLKIVIIYHLIINLVNSQKRLVTVIGFIMVLNGWIAFGVIKAYATGNVIYSGDVVRSVGLTAFLGDPNDLATTLAAGISFLVLLLPALKNRMAQAGLVILLMGSFIAIAYTGSRGGSIALAVVIFTLWLRSRKKIQVGVGLLALLMAFWVVAPGGYRNRILSIRNYKSDATSVSRQESWKAGIFLFKHHPIFGVGAQNFGVARAQSYAVTRSYADWQTAHSIYFQLLAELGLFGFACFLILMGGAFKNLRFMQKHLRGNPNALLALRTAYGIDVALVGYLSGGLFLSLAYIPTIYYLVGLAVAARQIIQHDFPVQEQPHRVSQNRLAGSLR